MVAALTLDFGHVSIYDDHFIVIVSEGEIITPDSNHIIKQIVDRYFANRPFGMVSHRKYQFSVDPRAYLDMAKFINLVGIAVVSHEGIGINNVEVEKRFFSKPFRHFLNLKDARFWIRELASIPS